MIATDEVRLDDCLCCGDARSRWRMANLLSRIRRTARSWAERLSNISTRSRSPLERVKSSPVALHFRIAAGHINSHTPKEDYLIPTVFRYQKHRA